MDKREKIRDGKTDQRYNLILFISNEVVERQNTTRGDVKKPRQNWGRQLKDESANWWSGGAVEVVECQQWCEKNSTPRRHFSIGRDSAVSRLRCCHYVSILQRSVFRNLVSNGPKCGWWITVRLFIMPIQDIKKGYKRFSQGFMMGSKRF